MVPSISYQEDSEFLSLCVVSDNHMRIKKLHIKDVTRLRLKPLSYQFTPVPLDARPLLYCHQCNAKQLQRQTMQRAFKGLGTIQNGVQETECTVHYRTIIKGRSKIKALQIEHLEYTFLFPIQCYIFITFDLFSWQYICILNLTLYYPFLRKQKPFKVPSNKMNSMS